MMAKSEDRHEDRSARLTTPALAMLLGFVAVHGFVVNGLLAMKTFWGPQGWQVLGSLAVDLLVVGAIWGVSRLKPSRAKVAALLVLLALVVLLAFGGTSALVRALLATSFLGLWYWKTLCMLAANVLVGAGAIWGFFRLEPWKGWKGSGEPVSPSTRKTNKLFGLSGLIVALSAVAVIYGAQLADGKSDPLFSNSPVSRGVAIFAVAAWLLGQAINKWWWYFSADEHERRAEDVGNLLGWALFFTVTPAWWVAARAGLVPQPNAMVLWIVTVGVSAAGYFWRRSP
jgi:hypothetical protein